MLQQLLDLLLAAVEAARALRPIRTRIGCVVVVAIVIAGGRGGTEEMLVSCRWSCVEFFFGYSVISAPCTLGTRKRSSHSSFFW